MRKAPKGANLSFRSVPFADMACSGRLLAKAKMNKQVSVSFLENPKLCRAIDLNLCSNNCISTNLFQPDR